MERPTPYTCTGLWDSRELNTRLAIHVSGLLAILSMTGYKEVVRYPLFAAVQLGQPLSLAEWRTTAVFFFLLSTLPAGRGCLGTRLRLWSMGMRLKRVEPGNEAIKKARDWSF